METKESLISISVTFAPSNKEGKTLSLALRSDEVKAGWRVPVVRYAVRRIELNFEVSDCLLPEEDWAIDPVSLLDTEIKYEKGVSEEASSNIEAGWSPASTTNTSLGTKTAASFQRAQSSSKSYSTTHQPVLAHGTSSSPKWTITSKEYNTPLLGTLINNSRFCRAEPTGISPKISVSYTIPFDGLLFRAKEGEFISGNRFGLVRLIFRSALCEKKIELINIDVE